MGELGLPACRHRLRPSPTSFGSEADREIVDEAPALAYLKALDGHDDLTPRRQRVATLRMLGRLDEAGREGPYEPAVREGRHGSRPQHCCGWRT